MSIGWFFLDTLDFGYFYESVPVCSNVDSSVNKRKLDYKEKITLSREIDTTEVVGLDLTREVFTHSIYFLNLYFIFFEGVN